MFCEQSTSVNEAKSSDTVETSVTNGAADDAIDNPKDDDKDDDYVSPTESPSVPAEEDCADEPMGPAAGASNQRVTADVIQHLSTLLNDAWIKLANQLKFQQDDITYFQSENSTPAAQATNMLTLWAVSTFPLFS